MSALHALSELRPGEQHERCAGERSGYRREEQVARCEGDGDALHDEWLVSEAVLDALQRTRSP